VKREGRLSGRPKRKANEARGFGEVEGNLEGERYFSDEGEKGKEREKTTRASTKPERGETVRSAHEKKDPRFDSRTVVRLLHSKEKGGAEKKDATMEGGKKKNEQSKNKISGTGKRMGE